MLLISGVVSLNSGFFVLGGSVWKIFGSETGCERIPTGIDAMRLGSDSATLRLFFVGEGSVLVEDGFDCSVLALEVPSC